MRHGITTTILLAIFQEKASAEIRGEFLQTNFQVNSAEGCRDGFLGGSFSWRTKKTVLGVQSWSPFVKRNSANFGRIWAEIWRKFGGNLAKSPNFGGIAPCPVKLGYFGDFGMNFSIISGQIRQMCPLFRPLRAPTLKTKQ